MMPFAKRRVPFLIVAALVCVAWFMFIHTSDSAGQPPHMIPILQQQTQQRLWSKPRSDGTQSDATGTSAESGILAALVANGGPSDSRPHDSPEEGDPSTADEPLCDASGLPATCYACRAGNISADDVTAAEMMTSGGFRVQIISNTLYVVHEKYGHQTRSQAMKLLLHSMLQVHSIPDVDFIVSTIDNPVPISAAFSFCRYPDLGYGLLPDFTFASWPEIGLADWRTEMDALRVAQASIPYETRIGKVFWRGANAAQVRVDAAHLAEAWPQYLDVKIMLWNPAPEPLQPSQPLQVPSDTYVPLGKHCGYRFLLHLEGVCYSSRLKYLLACNSTVFIAVADPECREFWQDALVPFEHFIPVKADLSDLVTQVQWALSYPDVSARIAAKGAELIYSILSRPKVFCYMAHTLRQYAALQTFEPSLHPDAVHVGKSLFYAGYHRGYEAGKDHATKFCLDTSH